MSLLARLLGLSLAVAAVAVVATALLAVHDTRLRDEVPLLETDGDIRAALLDHARQHRDWTGVGPLVRDLAERTGRRIALTTPDGTPIVDSAVLLGQGDVGLPSVPSAGIDATEPVTAALEPTGGPGLRYRGWRLTDEERAHRDALVAESVDCLRHQGDLPRQVSVNGPFATGPSRHAGDACIPAELSAPSAAAREVNDRAAERTAVCLDHLGLARETSTSTRKSPEWTQCEEDGRKDALRPHVAPVADLYLGTSDRFDPLSADAWWRTAGTVAVVLLVAAAVTVLAGRRLVRPILTLTTAARRMAAGDRGTRVPVRGNDEVTRLAHAFNAMAEAVGAGERQRRDLIGDVAHELRAPLANVRSGLEAAEDGVLPLDAALLRSLHEEAAVLERLVADLQDLALADAGELRVHPEDRDAADLARQAVTAHQARAEAAGITLRVDAPRPVTVFADPARLRQALGNLVSNAVRHTPPGGLVEVTVRGDGGEVVLTVTDTGPGIAAEHLPHVFDRFYRAGPSRGSGLGLAITKHLVEAHGGTVEVTSGAGSTFTVRLQSARLTGS